jgi:hypothetical protein
MQPFKIQQVKICIVLASNLLNIKGPENRKKRNTTHFDNHHEGIIYHVSFICDDL